MHGSGCQGRKSHYERCDGKNDKSAQKTCNNSKLQCFGSITPGTFQIALPNFVNKAPAAKVEAEKEKLEKYKEMKEKVNLQLTQMVK